MFNPVTLRRHHLSTPDAVLLDSGQDEAERELRGMDALLLELVLQVTPPSHCRRQHRAFTSGRQW